MITDLWIENFKGIGNHQHIPLRPITLLFGANSAGKSTVLHALLYLREILKNHDFDPKLPLDGENTVSLGGFHQLIARDESGEPFWPPRVSIKVRFRAFENQVHKFLERLNRTRYGRGGSLGFGTLRGEFVQDDLLEACSIYAGGWTQPIDIEFVIGAHDEEGQHSFLERNYSSPTDVMRWLKRISISISGEVFFDAELRKEERELDEMIGYINLLHPLWQAGPSSTADYKIRKAELRLGLMSVSRELQWGVVEPDGGLILVLGVLETVECFVLPWDRFEELFPDGDPALRVFYHVPLREYLEGICAESQRPNLAKLIAALKEKHSVKCMVILERGQQSVTDNESILTSQPDRLAGLLFKGEDHVPPAIFEVINLIRELIFFEYRGGVADRGGWGNLVILNGYHSILPSEDPVFPGGSTRVVERGSIKDSDFPILPDDTVSRAIKGSLTWLLEDLNDLLYVGPKRSTVPRDLSEKSMSLCQNWGNGLAAWRWLLEADDLDVATCNNWLLSEEKGLGTGYSITVERFREIKEPGWVFPDDLFADTTEDKEEAQVRMNDAYNKLYHLYNRTRPFKKLSLTAQANSARRHPQEVGEGITQVVPVIVACVKASLDNCMVAIEQPELHLHPSLAARLGDLFITTMFDTKATSYHNRRQCLIETHSEHLILRILRRIRQTTDYELPEHIPPVKPDDVCVLWVDNLGDGTVISRLRISDNGRWLDRWPDGFFRERHKELFE